MDRLPRPSPQLLAIQLQRLAATTIKASGSQDFYSPAETGLDFGVSTACVSGFGCIATSGIALAALCVSATFPGNPMSREHSKSRGEHHGGE